VTLKYLIDTCANAYANITCSKASKEIYCHGSPLRTSVSDMKYTITVFLSYDHGEIMTAQRHGESYSLLGRRLWPIADIWLRGVVVVDVVVSQTFATVASLRRFAAPIVLFTVPKFVNPRCQFDYRV